MRDGGIGFGVLGVLDGHEDEDQDDSEYDNDNDNEDDSHSPAVNHATSTSMHRTPEP